MLVIRNINDAPAFITKDGSEIRSLLDLSNSPVKNQSLAEATVLPGCKTELHHHQKSEEFYYVVCGSGIIEIDNEISNVSIGDAILIPPGSKHTIFNTGKIPLKILCCCAPAYQHDDTILD